jgi:molybdenum cofactor cytidylyltransferase
VGGHTVAMVLAVLLAAGGGSRYEGDTHKLLALLDGRPVLVHALDALAASRLEAVVVTGAADVDDLVPEGIGTVPNPEWAAGQATSVRAGIAEARRRGHDAIVVGLGDQPFVTAEAWRGVAGADATIAVATYDGHRGHPVRLGRGVWDLLPSTGDEVGRAVMRGRPELILEVPCDAGHPRAQRTADIDTLEDLHRWS